MRPTRAVKQQAGKRAKGCCFAKFCPPSAILAPPAAQAAAAVAVGSSRAAWRHWVATAAAAWAPRNPTGVLWAATWTANREWPGLKLQWLPVRPPQALMQPSSPAASCLPADELPAAAPRCCGWRVCRCCLPGQACPTGGAHVPQPCRTGSHGPNGAATAASLALTWSILVTLMLPASRKEGHRNGLGEQALMLTTLSPRHSELTLNQESVCMLVQIECCKPWHPNQRALMRSVASNTANLLPVTACILASP